MKAWRIAGLVVAAVLVLLFGTTWWLLFSESGARFALARTQGFLAPRLTVGAIQGTVAGPLRLRDIRWHDAEGGVDFTLSQAEIDLRLRDLLRATVHVRRAALTGMLLTLGPSTRPEPPDEGGDPLDPPIDVIVDAFALREARVVSNGTEQVHVTDAALAGAWTDAGLAVRQLDVRATQGEIHFAGQVAGSERYRGSGNGRFAWQVGERRYSGTLEARADDALADLKLRLGEPLTAQLALSLQQQQRLPWKFTLDIPSFDPRTGLLPDSSLSQLAVHLEGAGTLDEATTQGRVVLNDTTLEVRSLRARRDGEDIALDGALGYGAGTVALDGRLRPQAEPLDGRFAVRWEDIAIPEDLAGQALRTAGSLQIEGSLDAYAAQGNLQVGPPGRLADIRLNLTGSPQVIQLARFDIVQAQGRLTAAGVIGLTPQVTWTVGAAATAFDPGALLSEWPGRLDFRLASDGKIEEQGPAARVALQDLRGRLRGRALAGRAELQLGSDRALVGMADLTSGGSRVQIDATRNASGGEEARARIEIASAADWLPDARGSLRGRIDAHGRWPELAVTANLRASGLEYQGTAVREAQLAVDITRPLRPSGTASLDAQGASAAGFDFATVRLRARGDEAQHQLSFDAAGGRLSLGLDVAGGLREKTWSGTLSRLQIGAPDVAQLALQQPVTLSASADAQTFSQACLADGEMRLCLEGSAGPMPAFQARYSVHALPLRLAQAFADLPVAIDGTLDGDGDVRRDATGALAGQARLQSARGRITEVPTGDIPPRDLLAWQNLQADASLQGGSAQFAARATLNDQGKLDARVTASALTGPSPEVDGQLTVQLPGLGVVEAFVPQLMNVQGTLGIDTRFSGPIGAPRITGEARLSKLAFDLPQLNLKPRDGEVVARMQGDGPIQLEGSVHSGDGELAFKGQAQRDGQAEVKVTGSNVLAADIPGVKLTLAPNVTVKRDATRTDISGSVHIPAASVDLQRLPSAKKARSASPDVVVIDDADAQSAAARNMPLYASIDLKVGDPARSDAVKIKGYGLDATVSGELKVRERPGEPTTASGEMRVAGQYQAYGQDLTIQQGQLLFANSPIDNPRLAIVAVRTVDTVTAGFRVNGSARNPELSVFSDPAMGQANALAYIVAGKPLDDIGQGTGEGDALQSAARSLGTAAGGLLAKNVGKRLGVDEIGIKDSAAIGGAALTVGQYLSPRLYLGYGIGLFDPGQVVTLRYRLSRAFAIEAEQGTLNSRAGIQFRKEK